MKRQSFFNGIVLTGALILFFSAGCKKKRAFKEEDGQASVDTQMLQAENDAASSAVNVAIMDQYLLRGKSSGPTGAEELMGNGKCGLTLDTTKLFSGIVTLKYSGEICDGRKKEGVIRVAIVDFPLKKWKQKGCKLKMEFMDYKVTRISNGRSIKLNGSQYLTNESGKTWYELFFLNEPSLVYTAQAEDIQVTFEGNSSAFYSVSRRLTYTYSKSAVTCRLEGIGSHDGKTNVESWGTTRDGADFTCQLTTPLVWTKTCGEAAPVSGEMILNVEEKEHVLKSTFGTDEGGTQLSQDIGQCPYGYQLSWSYKNRTTTRVFPYN